MKYVRLMGGIGNQMFQYAFGILLGKHTIYDISWFNEVKNVPTATQREYELDFWDIAPKLTNNPKNKTFGFIKINKYFEKPENIYNEKLLKLNNCVIEGYFQVAKYYDAIRDKLLSDFTPKKEPNSKNKKMLNLIHSTNSVSIHVRRGDYVKLQQIHGLCNLDYYKHAIKYITKHVSNPHFFIFSDDIQWVKDNLKIDCPCEYIDFNNGRDSAWDMWLMANCKHNIIANSSFSWWGAWLNPKTDKIVIAPKQWFANGTATDIVPIDWKRL